MCLDKERTIRTIFFAYRTRWFIAALTCRICSNESAMPDHTQGHCIRLKQNSSSGCSFTFLQKVLLWGSSSLTQVSGGYQRQLRRSSSRGSLTALAMDRRSSRYSFCPGILSWVSGADSAATWDGHLPGGALVKIEKLRDFQGRQDVCIYQEG